MAVTLNIGFLMICIIAAEMSRAADSDILFPTCVCVTVMEWIDGMDKEGIDECCSTFRLPNTHKCLVLILL